MSEALDSHEPRWHSVWRVFAPDPETVLLVCLGLILFVQPLAGQMAYGDLALDIAVSLVTVSALLAITTRRGVRMLGGVVAVSALVSQWLQYLDGVSTRALFAWQSTSSALLLGLVAWYSLQRVVASGRVTTARVRGAVVAYLLIGMMFSHAYVLAELAQPGAIATQHEVIPLSDDAGKVRAWQGEFVYFSFVTLTTLGYGDILPVSEIARRLAILEALLGQLFLATLLARLVSLEVAHRRDPD